MRMNIGCDKMKNIYIFGVPRSGKSTLAKLIKEKYPFYNQISFEAIRNGFIKSQPDLDMGNRSSDARKNILPKHIVEFSHWNNKLLTSPTLVEGDFCSIEDLYNLIDDNDLIICLGLGRKSLDEILKGIRQNDKEIDYTKDWTDEKIKTHFYDIENKDKENYDFCMSHNIKYYDTYDNRNNIFDKIIEDISRQK